MLNAQIPATAPVITIGELAVAILRGGLAMTIHHHEGGAMVQLANGSWRYAEGRDSYAAQSLAVTMFSADPFCLGCGTHSVKSSIHHTDFGLVTEYQCYECGDTGAF